MRTLQVYISLICQSSRHNVLIHFFPGLHKHAIQRNMCAQTAGVYSWGLYRKLCPAFDFMISVLLSRSPDTWTHAYILEEP
jgi:hypothetical protein